MILKQPLSIIYLHNQRLMGGKAHDIVIMRTCYALAKSGHKVKIITGRLSRRNNIFSYYGFKPIPEFEVIQVPMLRGRPFSWHAIFNIFCLLKILNLKKRGMADIIYLREIKLARFLLKFKKLLNLPFVIEVHDLKIKKFYDSCPERDRSEDYVFNRVNGIIVLLNVFGNILKETYKISGIPIVKVPLAAEKTAFHYKQTGHKIIGYIGQLYPMQGVDILIQAMSYLPDARLSVIGGAEKDLTRLKKLAVDKKVEKKIDFHGFISPHMVSEKAREVDLMVICALDRGKRRYSAHTKLYEYMAMGKPIVAVDLPSIREEVTDGKDVILAKPEDPQDLAEKITYVLHNHNVAESLALTAYKSADEYSWEKRATRLSDFFIRFMQTIKGNKKSEKKIKIRFGISKSLILLFSGFNNLLWFKEKIFDLLNGKEGIPVKSSHFTTVLKFQNPKTGEIFYFKEFHDRCLKDKIKKFFRLIRSKRAFRAGQLLLKNGFLTPIPVVYGIEKKFCFIKKNFLITKEVPEERTYQYFQAHFQLPLSAAMFTEKRALIHAAGHEIGRLHRMGIFHGDLRVGNIIINGKGASAQFFFIDNERTRHYRVIPERKRIKNLVQLNMVLLPQITKTDRLRFFNTYISENPLLSAHKKSLMKTILQITKKRHDSKSLR